MVQEEYVSFETARLLKEKGFQQKEDNSGYHTTEMVYGLHASKDGSHHFAHRYPAGAYNFDSYICAPTLQMAMRWLREVKGLVIIPDYCRLLYYPTPYYFHIYTTTGDNGGRDSDKSPADPYYDYKYKTYEEACEAAIKYCLEKLI